MKATQFLRDNHKVMRGLFSQLETADDRHPEMKEGLRRELKALFEVHSTIEEELFYPALRAALAPGEQPMIDEALASHQSAASLPESQLADFITSVETHMRDEELRMFERAEQLLGTELEQLGQRLEARHRELLGSAKYRDARPEVVQNPNGGEQLRKQEKVA